MDVHSNRRAMQWWSKGAVVILGTLTLSPGTGIALASDTATRPTIGDTTIFASAPAPGHLFGVAVDNDRIYVSTSAGDFFADPPTGGHLNSDGERVFAYDRSGRLVQTTIITTRPNADNGLVRSRAGRKPKAGSSALHRGHERADPPSIPRPEEPHA